MKIPGLVLLLVLLCGCTSVPVTLRSIAAVPDRAKDREAAIACLRGAVEIANGFLASDFRKTLPPGELVLSDDSLVFVTPGRTLPVNIRCAVAGDILPPFGMAAQERADGFVVGQATPRQHREIDNTLFRLPSGQAAQRQVVAALILHELTHSYLEVGTVSFAKTVRYYAEAVFLLRYRNHSMEREPYRTSAEFWAYARDRMERARAAAGKVEAPK